MPPSEVENFCPSEVVTMAELALFAVTETKFAGTGGGIFDQWLPSFVSRIAPPSPTSQQVFAAGADPAVSFVFGSGSCPFHVAPISSERSTNPPPAILQSTLGSGVAMIVSADRCSPWPAGAWFAAAYSRILPANGACFVVDKAFPALSFA